MTDGFLSVTITGAATTEVTCGAVVTTTGFMAGATTGAVIGVDANSCCRASFSIS